ncbi:peptidoglycan-binding domain-containing protein [Microcoleus sp. FACHB-672]|uniref:peptidoglycan-binding domain-containing protein n=1 Tax=Microcoleus sp. FACHB-672 TaxID=2692825 RepID=UPI001687E9A5|nr:peptidoglycan-binding protein [Microcoleus sp. FACHB-672]MBD2040188.1 peptidoglycan-binding protein [Microcoleus sp. FACHB-672]
MLLSNLGSVEIQLTQTTVQLADKQLSSAQTTAQLNKPLLVVGSKGQAVKELQKLLIHWGYYLTIDGIFGQTTLEIVKAFQRRVFLKPDGIVGNLTWQALYIGSPNMPILQRGSKGQAVITLQETLQITGHYTERIDGDFGSITDAAVRSFQKDAGLVADGIVGSRTWYAMSKIFAAMGC